MLLARWRCSSVVQLVVTVVLGFMLVNQAALLVRRKEQRPIWQRQPLASTAAASAPVGRACSGWGCVGAKQGRGAIQLIGSGGGAVAAPSSVPAQQDEPSPRQLEPPPPSISPSSSPPPVLALPEHGCGDDPATADYFCCNRAVGPAELSAVSTASMTDFIATGGRFPVVMVTYDRAAMLDKTLQSLLRVRCVRPADVYVVQDGALAEVRAVLDRHGVRSHQKLVEGQQAVRGGKPPEGAERIAQHFRYALNHAFLEAFPRAAAVIVAEDDFLFAPDFYEYFHAVAPALEADASLWLASAWNDNGFDYLVADPNALKRSRFFPGLGWLLPRRVWMTELAAGWPDTHWDHWMRDPARHRGRDIVIPEIPRAYHAGIKGTFMDTTTHNRYFGSIALQADARFSWDSAAGADAVAALLQPRYGAELAAVLSDPATVHLFDVPAILALRAGTGVVWYESPVNVPDHAPFRGLAAFFGIWHEGGRGSREGVHRIWWLGTARLLLVNACADPVAAGAGSVYITGSVECAGPEVKRLMRAGPGQRPLDWSAFPPPPQQPPGQQGPGGGGGLERPPLPAARGWLGAVVDAPLAHLEGGADANGPPDAPPPRRDAAAQQQLERAAKPPLPGGGGPHHRFMGSLELPPLAPQPSYGDVVAAGGAAAGAGPASRFAAGGAPLTLPATVRAVRSRERGASCTEVCRTAAAPAASACAAAYLPALNDCATLRAHFDCAQCADSVGSDQPAMIDRAAPADKLPGHCLVNGDPRLFSCDGKWQFALRLCPCEAAAGAQR